MHYLLIIIAYFVGAIPFGLLIGRSLGVDVRRSGSGNIGATNVNRLLGKKLGALTLLCDTGKGILPMWLALWLLPAGGSHEITVLLCGAAAFLGHIFPVYLGFIGGKGVATALGIFLFLEPIAALMAIGVFVGTVMVSGFVSLGSIGAALLMPCLIWLLKGKVGHVTLAAAISLLIVLKHWSNIGRLIRHEEKSWKNRDTAPPGEQSQENKL
jgi:glycerol-3-phosphate acyltransferase PlsY